MAIFSGISSEILPFLSPLLSDTELQLPREKVFIDSDVLFFFLSCVLANKYPMKNRFSN